MEKDQNTNSGTQNNDTEDIKAEETINEAQPDVSDNNEKIKEDYA